MPQATNNNPPRKFADRYRVDAPIGQGAHATTWRGWDERLDRSVAIKILHSHLASDQVFVERFRAEARVAASVRQANVVDVYDFGQQDGTLYIVMQFIDGEDLKSLIQRSAPLPVREVRRIIGNVLDGLHAIHAVGIVHRDIKPQNVLIGQDGVARVTDFGVADVQSTAGLTGEGLTIGTVDYMAPEQAQGLTLTPAADLYATGVILYEMLTGTLPFAGATSRETMLQHINGTLIPPSSRMPERGITPAIDAVVAQSLAKDPARRFGSARAMKQAVGQALAASPSAASAQTTTLLSAQPQMSAPVPPPMYQQPDVYDRDAGAGLNGAFKALVAVLLIGALGVALWGATQLLESDRFNLDLPSIFQARDDDVTPTPVLAPTDPPVESVPIEPADTTDNVVPPVVEPPQQAPTEIPPTELPALVEPTAAPTEPPVEEEPAPIEPIEPESVPTDEPVIDPAGYDGANVYV